MQELIHQYKKLIQLLENEQIDIAQSLDGDFLEQYRRILQQEKEQVETKLQALRNHQITKGV